MDSFGEIGTVGVGGDVIGTVGDETSSRKRSMGWFGVSKTSKIERVLRPAKRLASELRLPSRYEQFAQHLVAD